MAICTDWNNVHKTVNQYVMHTKLLFIVPEVSWCSLVARYPSWSEVIVGGWRVDEALGPWWDVIQVSSLLNVGSEDGDKVETGTVSTWQDDSANISRSVPGLRIWEIWNVMILKKLQKANFFYPRYSNPSVVQFKYAAAVSWTSISRLKHSVRFTYNYTSIIKTKVTTTIIIIL